MFFGSSSGDLSVVLLASVVALIISVVAFIKTKKWLISLSIFSISTNLIIYATILTESMMFRYYGILWLKSFSSNIWPYINIALFVLLMGIFIKNKNEKEK